MKIKFYFQIIFCVLFCTSVKFGDTRIIKASNIQQELVKIKGNLYAFKTEVSNKWYKLFLISLLDNKDTLTYNKCFIDSVAWMDLSNEINTCFEYFDNYHTAALYDYYPVVNISYEAANLFCEWLTHQYHLNFWRKFRKVQFRLPSEEEWLLAAIYKNTYTWGDTSLYEKKSGGAKARLKFVDKSNLFFKDYPSIPAVVKSFSKNKLGLYNVNGNVSEMISEEGKAKGGSWLDYPTDATNDKVQMYDKPFPTIGFRVFMKVLEK